MQLKSCLCKKVSLVLVLLKLSDSLIVLQWVHLRFLQADTDPVEFWLKFIFEWMRISPRFCGLLNAKIGLCWKTYFTLYFSDRANKPQYLLMISPILGKEGYHIRYQFLVTFIATTINKDSSRTVALEASSGFAKPHYTCTPLWEYDYPINLSIRSSKLITILVLNLWTSNLLIVEWSKITLLNLWQTV